MTDSIDVEAKLIEILKTPPLDKIMERIRETVPAEGRQQIWEATLAIIEISRKVPHHLIGQAAKVLGTGYFFFAEYGFFLAIWSYFEIVVEVLIMRELGLRPREASIVCGGLGFGTKLNMLFSLLARNQKNAEGIALLKRARESAERNSFAHGFLYYDESEKEGGLLIRNVKDKYFVESKPLNIELFAKHVVEFLSQVSAVIKHFRIDPADCMAYTRSIAIDARDHAAQASRRRESRSNARLAKKQSRLRPQQKPPG